MAGDIGIISKASDTKRRVGRSLSVNGVHAVDIDLKKSQNLSDPILDVNLKVNNPIGRLWLALKRLWKSQNTVIDFKLTIPLIVLPIVIYVAWTIWQGRGVSEPVSKLGIVHQIKRGTQYSDILVMPSSDVYMLAYSADFTPMSLLREKPVIVMGTYRHFDGILTVDQMIAYNPADIVPSGTPAIESRSTWDRILQFIRQFK